MNAPPKMEAILELLEKALDSLDVCLRYELDQKQYSVASLLLHVMECIEEALKAYDKKEYAYKSQLRKSCEASRKLVERGR